MFVRMNNKETGDLKRCKVGVSWTSLFFGWIVPLFRGDWVWFATMLLTTLVFGSLSSGVAGFMVNIVMFIIYNKYYIQGLGKKGYTPASGVDAKVLASHNI